MVALQAEEAVGRLVHISDLAFVIEQDDPLLERLKDLFEEAFFTQQFQHHALDLARFQAVHAFDELVDEGGSHKMAG